MNIDNKKIRCYLLCLGNCDVSTNKLTANPTTVVNKRYTCDAELQDNVPDQRGLTENVGHEFDGHENII